YKGNAGFTEDMQALDRYRELMLSEKVMQRLFNKWIYMSVLQKKTPFAFKQREGIPNLPIEWQYNFNNRNYKPFDISITNPEVAPEICPVPTNLRNTGHEGDVYHFSFDTAAGQQSYIVETSFASTNDNNQTVTYPYSVKKVITENTFDLTIYEPLPGFKSRT